MAAKGGTVFSEYVCDLDVVRWLGFAGVLKSIVVLAETAGR